MTVSSYAAAPIPITIKGERVNLPLVTLYEITLAEESFRCKLEREHRLKTIGLPTEERDDMRARLAQELLSLDVDYTPVLEWVVLNRQGRLTLMQLCLDSAYPGQYSMRDCAIWYAGERNGQTINGRDLLEQWLIDSGLLADPTKASSTATTQDEAAEEAMVVEGAEAPMSSDSPT